MKLRALIADDEPLARERLRFLLSEDKDFEIAGECRNGREVVAALKESPLRRSPSRHTDAGKGWFRDHRAHWRGVYASQPFL